MSKSSLKQTLKDLDTKKISIRELNQDYLKRIKENENLNVFIHFSEENVLKQIDNLENDNSEKKFKLNAGEIIIYPSTYLHAVKKIKNGERIVCVGWIESYVKSIEVREYLFDLDAGAKGLLANNGRSDELDLIFKSYSNFLRLLGS